MTWRIVKQPDGLLARFSSVVDGFTHTNMTETEALEVCQQYGLDILAAQKKVLEGVESGPEQWNDCVQIVEVVHSFDLEGQGENYDILF